MKNTLTNQELAALAHRVIDRLHADLAEDETVCDCLLHRLSKEERAERIDKAIEEAAEEFRGKGE